MAGVRNSGGPWDSSVFQRIKGFDFTLNDGGGTLDFDVSLESDSPDSAVAIQNVLNGLLGLYMLSGERDPDVDQLTNGLSIRTSDATVRVSNQIEARALLDLID